MECWLIDCQSLRGIKHGVKGVGIVNNKLLESEEDTYTN